MNIKVKYKCYHALYKIIKYPFIISINKGNKTLKNINDIIDNNLTKFNKYVINIKMLWIWIHFSFRFYLYFIDYDYKDLIKDNLNNIKEKYIKSFW